MHINLEPRQTDAYTTEATEVLYGGAAGGGKSFYLRVSAIRWCLEVPGIQVYLFRRTLTDLRDNHLRGPTSFFVLLADGIERKQIRYRAVENEFEFPGNSTLHLCYCDSENDVEKYRGAEMHVLILDELTHFSEYQYRFLRSRVRRAGLKVTDGYKARLPRIEAGSNPGSIGHAWVKRSFISPKPPMEKWKTPPEEGGMLRQFIPAKLSDNPHLTNDDPEYANRLKGLGADSLVRAMLDGDWDIVAGQAFEKLRPETHRLEPFDIPKDWLRFGSLDWGSTRPFSYGMWTICGEDTTVDKIKVQRGAMIRYDEWYGWNGTPNEGIRMEAGEVARGILDREDGVRMAYRIADSSMWKVDGGPSIAETFNKFGCVLRPSSKGPGSRHAGYVEVRQRIAGNDDGPMLFATKNCHAGFWRTMPDLVMDEHRFGLKSEQIDCWVAGTKVSTPQGDLAIEDVRKGDVVDTPIGPRVVLKSYLSGASETMWVELSNGTRLQGTPHHKIFVQGKGLVPLKGVECGDILTERTIWISQKRLHMMALFTNYTRGTNTTSAGFTFIRKFGLMPTAKFLKDFTSTIKTKFQRTIDSITLSAFRPENTLCAITTADRHCGNSKVLGQHLMKGSQFFERIFEKSRHPCRREHLRAAIVENLLLQRSRTKNTALMFASNTITGLSKIVKSAANTFGLKSIKPEKSAPVRILAVGRSEEKVAVYNLTVDEAHLFYANGVLSSNTDQEDHVSDEVAYSCSSRPWLRNVKPDALKKRDWLFDQREVEEDTWRTA